VAIKITQHKDWQSLVSELQQKQNEEDLWQDQPNRGSKTE
jgi:hypothetical protein